MNDKLKKLKDRKSTLEDNIRTSKWNMLIREYDARQREIRVNAEIKKWESNIELDKRQSYYHTFRHEGYEKIEDLKKNMYDHYRDAGNSECGYNMLLIEYKELMRLMLKLEYEM